MEIIFVSLKQEYETENYIICRKFVSFFILSFGSTECICIQSSAQRKNNRQSIRQVTSRSYYLFSESENRQLKPVKEAI